MTTDLTMLVWSVGLAAVQILIGLAGSFQAYGLMGLAGNRQDLVPLDGWADRAQKAHRNLLESLVLFAILVLVAAVSGKANASTALGAEIFFWARVAYVPVFLIGIPFLRTGVWMVSMAGLVMIFLQLV